MISRKLTLTAAFGSWLFVLGLLLESEALLLAAVPVWLYAALSLASAPPHLDVAVSRSLPRGQLYEGDEGVVTVRVENRGRRTDLEVMDELSPGLRVVKGANHVFATVGPGETREFRYSVSPWTFGTYSLGPVRVRATDAASSRYVETTVQTAETLRAYPEVKYLGRVEMRHPHPRNWPGETVARRAGQGMEFYGVRERAPGDPLRKVNWKATARTGRLMVNEQMDEAGGETLVILDLRSVSRVGSPPESSAEYSVHAVSAIAYRLVRDRNRVGLLSVGARLVKVPLGSGRRHFGRILLGLVAERGGSSEGWDLAVIPHYLSMFYSRTVQVVLVSPVTDDAPLVLTAELSRRGYDVMVVSPSAIPLDLPPRRRTPEWELAKELALMDRKRKLSAMARHAVVVDWDPHGSLAAAVTSASRQKRHR